MKQRLFEEIRLCYLVRNLLYLAISKEKNTHKQGEKATLYANFKKPQIEDRPFLWSINIQNIYFDTESISCSPDPTTNSEFSRFLRYCYLSK